MHMCPVEPTHIRIVCFHAQLCLCASLCADVECGQNLERFNRSHKCSSTVSAGDFLRFCELCLLGSLLKKPRNAPKEAVGHCSSASPSSSFFRQIRSSSSCVLLLSSALISLFYFDLFRKALTSLSVCRAKVRPCERLHVVTVKNQKK